MTIEMGSSHWSSPTHRSLAPRKQNGLDFEIEATRPQLDTLNRLIHDERIPAPIAYGIQQYMVREQLTKETASDCLDILLGYLNRQPSNPAKEPGLYVDPQTGAFYLLKLSQSNRLYALDLVINDRGEKNPDGTWKTRPRFEWVYENGGAKAKQLRVDWKATREQVKQWGDIWGTCIKCHAELTKQVSIEQGMGPTCWKKQFA